MYKNIYVNFTNPPYVDPAGTLELAATTGGIKYYTTSFSDNIVVSNEYSLLVTALLCASFSTYSFSTPTSNLDGSFTRFPDMYITFPSFYRKMCVYFIKNPSVGTHTISYSKTTSSQTAYGIGVLNNYGESDREFSENYTIVESQTGTSPYEARGYITAMMYGTGSASVSPTGATQKIYAGVHNQAGFVLDVAFGLGYSPVSTGFGWSGDTSQEEKQVIIPIL